MRSATIISKIAVAFSLFYASGSIVLADEDIREIYNRQCKVSPVILEAIAKVERHAKRPPGYPFLISFNNEQEAKVVQDIIGKEVFLDWRTIDCKNSEICIKISEYVIHTLSIQNMDLGAYQINFKHHKMPLKNYFSFEDSYFKACHFLETLINQHGYTWETIARYHSATPKYNYAYLEKISTILKKENNGNN